METRNGRRTALWTILVTAALVGLTKAHSFHIGDCPKVEPMSGFDMEKFLGKWYVIQKTSSSNKNQVLTYSHGDEVGEFKLVEDAVWPVIGRTEYTGKLKPTDEVALWKVKFKLNPASYDYVIFMTDYENYAGVFSCQKALGANRRAATILSRKPKLDITYLDKVRDKLRVFGVNTDDLSEIEQEDVESGGGRDAEGGSGPVYDLDPRFGSHNSSELHLF